MYSVMSRVSVLLLSTTKTGTKKQSRPRVTCRTLTAVCCNQKPETYTEFFFYFSPNLVVVWITCLVLSTSILGSALPTSKWQSSLLTTNKISLSSLAFAFLSSLQWVSRSPSNHTSSSSRRTSFSVGKNDGRRRIGSLQETLIDQLQYRGYDKLSRCTGILPTHT